MRTALRQPSVTASCGPLRAGGCADAPRRSRRCRPGSRAGRSRPGSTPGPKARIGTCSRVWSVPRQVGSLPWSAVTMARSPGRSGGPDLRDAAVEGLERGRVAGHVAAVAELRVEVDEVDEHQAAVRQRAQRREGGVEAGRRCRRPSPRGRCARWAKMSPTLPTRDDRPAGAPQRGRAPCRCGGGDRRSPCGWAVRANPASGRADERPRDHAADPERIAQPARDARRPRRDAPGRSLLVRGDLEHAVGGGVADRLAGPDVLGAERVDDRRARRRAGRRGCPGRPPRAISASVSSGGKAGSAFGK